MYFTIDDTEVYQFRKPPLLQRLAVRVSHPTALRVIGILTGISAVITAIVSLVVIVGTYRMMDSYSYSGSLPDLTPSFSIFIVSMVVLGLAIALSAFTDAVRIARWNIAHQRTRLSFVTSEDYSYNVVFSPEVLIALNGTDRKNAARLQSLVNLAFSYDEVVKADTDIRWANKKIDGTERAYKAKLVVIDKVEAFLHSQGYPNEDHFVQLREAAEQAFLDRLAIIKEGAMRKIDAVDALTNR